MRTELRSKSQVVTDLNNKLMARVSHMVGHRISGPIATMLGLIELIEMNKCQKDKICPLVSHLKASLLKLKENCKELGDLVYDDKLGGPL